MSGYYLKDPSESADYSIDWATGYLTPDETLVVDLGWAIFPQDHGDDALSIDAASFDAGFSTVVLSGGRIGAVYRITSRVQTSAGRIAERSLVIRIANR